MIRTCPNILRLCSMCPSRLCTRPVPIKRMPVKRLLPHARRVSFARACLKPLMTAIFVPQALHPATLSAFLASAGTPTYPRTALVLPSQMALPFAATETLTIASRTHRDDYCASNSSSGEDAPSAIPFTSVRDVEAHPMVHPPATSLLNFAPPVPYNVPNWAAELDRANLANRYPSLVSSLSVGFDAGIRIINSTFAPKNSTTLDSFNSVFIDIIGTEFSLGRYKGPYTQSQVETLIGPFQSSPLSLVPKSIPGSFRLIQNLSFPFHPIPRLLSNRVSSINSSISSDFFPCTWGTFSEASLLFLRLPPGSQASTRDVADAYRTIPLAQDQWPGTVVRLSDKDEFAINLCNCFGLASAGGNWGILADAFCDIARAKGIGPLTKWVDDFLFARIPCTRIHAYNISRAKWAAEVAKHPKQQTRSRLFFRGGEFPDGRLQESSENFALPIRNMSPSSSDSPSGFAYDDRDLDALSQALGVPWKTTKSSSFAETVVYLGFEWDITNKRVSLPSSKKAKYLEAIRQWASSHVHTLREVETVYGKLMHAAHVSPEGRAYLTGLETMLSIFGNSPDCPRHAPKSVASDLAWWRTKLGEHSLSRPLPSTDEFPDIRAFSDASSSVGIGLTIGTSWSAFWLVPGWQAEGRDIAWAEAIGFELLLIALDDFLPYDSKVLIFGDNQVVVQGWRNGRSRNKQVNEVFKRIHKFAARRSWSVVARYVESQANPADGPSRGIFPSGCFLRATSLPRYLKDLVIPISPDLIRSGTFPLSGALPKPATPRDDLAGEESFHESVRALHSFELTWQE